MVDVSSLLSCLCLFLSYQILKSALIPQYQQMVISEFGIWQRDLWVLLAHLVGSVAIGPKAQAHPLPFTDRASVIPSQNSD